MLEKGLADRVEVVPAQTRTVESPYYGINPSGRVPYLIRDDGVGLEESTLICDYLDRLDGKPAFALPAGDAAWEARRLEGLARSMLDGLSVWLRELYRPPDERSPGVIRHETARSERMVDLWEKEIAHPLMRGAAQHAEPHARLRARARSAQSRFPLAARPFPARRVVRADRGAPVVRGDGAASGQLDGREQRIDHSLASWRERCASRFRPADRNGRACGGCQLRPGLSRENGASGALSAGWPQRPHRAHRRAADGAGARPAVDRGQSPGPRRQHRHRTGREGAPPTATRWCTAGMGSLTLAPF